LLWWESMLRRWLVMSLVWVAGCDPFGFGSVVAETGIYQVDWEVVSDDCIEAFGPETSVDEEVVVRDDGDLRIPIIATTSDGTVSVERQEIPKSGDGLYEREMSKSVRCGEAEDALDESATWTRSVVVTTTDRGFEATVIDSWSASEDCWALGTEVAERAETCEATRVLEYALIETCEDPCRVTGADGVEVASCDCT